MDSQAYIKLAKDAVNILTNMVMDPNSKFTKEHIAKIIPKTNDILGTIAGMAARMATLEGELNIYKTQPQHPQPSSSAIADVIGISETIAEMEERKNRSKNILLFNIPESTATLQSDCINDDLSQVTNILKKVDNVDTTNLQMYRLGRKSTEKTRPIKIILSDVNQAKLVLMKKSIHSNNNTIKIKHDLTVLQRQQISSLWKELENRQNNGEANLSIKYINSTPKIITSLPKNSSSRHQEGSTTRT